MGTEHDRGLKGEEEEEADGGTKKEEKHYIIVSEALTASNS